MEASAGGEWRRERKSPKAGDRVRDDRWGLRDGCGVEVVDGFYVGSGDGFDGEGAGDAGAGIVDERLVVEGFFAWRFVVGDGFQRDVGNFFVFEAAANAFVGVGEFVVVEGGAHEALFGEGGCDSGGVAGDPAAAPLLGHEGCRAGAASGVK